MMKKLNLKKLSVLALLSMALLVTSCSVIGKKSVVKSNNSGVYYSLFVRSFADSDGDGIGDFNGISAKASYLENLGISGVWLLPIFESPSYHGYDVQDYYKVNSDYGTMEDFESMIKELKKHNIKVIIDMPLDHSSNQNQWFILSENPDDPHHAWYRWAQEGDGYNLNTQIWGHKVWLESSRYPSYYYSALFNYDMPDFNLDNPEVREEFKSILKFWMDKGVSGFRFDAAGHVYNTAKIKTNQDSLINAQNFWKEMTEYTKLVNPESYSVAEVWDNSSVRSSYLKGLDSVFHFNMGDRIIDVLKFQKDTNNSYAYYLKNDYDTSFKSNPYYTDSPFLTNHDQGRAAGMLVGNREACKAGASLYLLTQGTPFVYYGEEIGMMSGSEDSTKRSPLLWGKNDKYNCTWEDSIYNKKTLSIAEQKKDKSSLYNYYKNLINFRNSSEIFTYGTFIPYDCDTENVSSWTMNYNEEKALVLVNITGENKTVNLRDDFSASSIIFRSNDENKKSSNKIILKPYGTVVLQHK